MTDGMPVGGAGLLLTESGAPSFESQHYHTSAVRTGASAAADAEVTTAVAAVAWSMVSESPGVFAVVVFGHKTLQDTRHVIDPGLKSCGRRSEDCQ